MVAHQLDLEAIPPRYERGMTQENGREGCYSGLCKSLASSDLVQNPVRDGLTTEIQTS